MYFVRKNIHYTNNLQFKTKFIERSRKATYNTVTKTHHLHSYDEPSISYYDMLILYPYLYLLQLPVIANF